MKYTIKKFLSLALVIVMVLSLAACGESGTSSSNPSSTPVDNASQTTSLDVTSEDTNSGTSSTTTSNESSSSQRPTSSDNVSSNDTSDEEYEKPNAGNDTVLYNKQTSKYDSQANTLRQKIINAKDSGLKGTKTYYVSYRGDDFNDGTSPSSAWKTIDMVNNYSMPANSVVLFERGGVYRGSLELKSNTSYGAYGSGSKPCIYGSKKNYADESLWKKSTKYEGAWQITVDEKDVGQIVFDHGKQVATNIPVGKNTAEQYQFAFIKGTIHLFVPNNPAKLYSDIEISGYDHVLYADSNGAENILVENLCIKYGGRHGMSFSFCENITVRNCEVGYIGGVGGQVPLGNGIEFWLDTKNVTVENCWVYQCFDAGITNQGQRNDGKKNIQEGITYKDNLIEYCIYGIEYFAGQGSAGSTIKDTLYTGNIIRFSGMGWSKPDTRVGETAKTSAVSAINGWASNTNVGIFPAENFVIENNIFDTSWKYMISVVKPNTSGNVTVRNNTYYQKSSENASIWYNENKQVVYVEDLAQMKTEIAKIDSSPKSVGLD